MKKVAFHNLGCKVNSYELDGISQMFQNRGYEIVDFAQKVFSNKPIYAIVASQDTLDANKEFLDSLQKQI